MEETRSIKIAKKSFECYKSFGRTVTSRNSDHEDGKIVLKYDNLHYLPYGLDGPGIESRWGARFSAPVQTGPGAHPASFTMGTGSFLGLKSGRVVTLTPHPLLVPWSYKNRAIPLLPLWAVRRVQILSACTRGHFTFTLPSRNLVILSGKFNIMCTKL